MINLRLKFDSIMAGRSAVNPWICLEYPSLLVIESWNCWTRIFFWSTLPYLLSSLETAKLESAWSILPYY